MGPGPARPPGELLVTCRARAERSDEMGKREESGIQQRQQATGWPLESELGMGLELELDASSPRCSLSTASHLPPRHAPRGRDQVAGCGSMQMAAAPPGPDTEPPSSPASAAANAPSPATGMSKFSLLGQQLHYSAPPQQQDPAHQQQQQAQVQQQQQQVQQQQQIQQQQQVQQQLGRSGLSFSLGGGGGGGGLFSQPPPPQQQPPRGYQGPLGLGYELLDSDAGGGAFLGRAGGGNGGLVPPAPDLMSALAVIHQGIGQVQALLPMMTAGAPPNSVLAHQQAVTAQRLAGVISQLAMAAAAIVQQQALQPAGLEHMTFGNTAGGAAYNMYQHPQPQQQMQQLQHQQHQQQPQQQQQQPQQQQPPQQQPQQHGGGGMVGGSLMGTSSYNPAPPPGPSVMPPGGAAAAMAMAGARGRSAVMPTGSGVVGGTPGLGSDLVDSGLLHGGVVVVEEESGAGSRDEDDDLDGDNLPPGSYDLIEMEAVEILAEHTHFCEICGKGFKRDANLRMHMRGHGDEYKTPAALARPERSGQEPLVSKPRRYSCPCVGCKRNKKHRKFQPLKTMLCVKNHYRRSHCPKSLLCTKCKTKKFSVMADLKTHEKHCGRDKWQCSCGTTFSRKDKLFGHIALFQGHTPAMPLHEMEEHGMESHGSGAASAYAPPPAPPPAPAPSSSSCADSLQGLHGLYTSNFLQGSAGGS